MTERPFYVGYLKLPRGLVRPLAAIVACLAVLDAGMALLYFRAQPPPPSGGWLMGEASYDGVLRARPYPHVLVAGPAGWRSVLLVAMDKHGAPPGTASLDGRHVAVTGYPILRGDVTVLQLDRSPAPADGPAPVPPEASAPVPRRLTGEVVDAKCWAGAMNPGDGKVHKGCGSLCLLGGIPALFVADDGHWYLLADPSGGPVGDELRGLVGERATLAGTVSEGAGMAVFAAGPA